MGYRLADRFRDIYHVLNVNARAKTIYGRKVHMECGPPAVIGDKSITAVIGKKHVIYHIYSEQGGQIIVTHDRNKRLQETYLGKRPDLAYAIFFGWCFNGKSSIPALEILKTKYEKLEMGVELCPAPLMIDLLSEELKVSAKKLKIDCKSTRPLSLHVVSC